MVTTDLPGDRPRRILLIEDSKVDRHWLRSRLSSSQVEIFEASDGLTGLEASQAEPPDLILLDLGLPYCDGFEILRRLKEDSRTSHVPVIVVSATSAPADKARGLDGGAVDYVTKPYDLLELQARIRVAFRTKRLQDLLEQRAHVDGLTGLANRLALEDRLVSEWALHKRLGTDLSVWVADLDHFKRINDNYGHAVGDEVLRQSAAVLRSTLRATDLAARYGGEEFVVISPHCDHAGAMKAAERFRECLAGAEMELDRGITLSVTVSIGVTTVPDETVPSTSEMLVRADLALYQAKHQGRNRVHGQAVHGPHIAHGLHGWALTRV